MTHFILPVADVFGIEFIFVVTFRDYFGSFVSKVC